MSHFKGSLPLLLWNDGCNAVHAFPQAWKVPQPFSKELGIQGQGLDYYTERRHSYPCAPSLGLRKQNMAAQLHKAFKIFKSHLDREYLPTNNEKRASCQVRHGMWSPMQRDYTWYPENPTHIYHVIINKPHTTFAKNFPFHKYKPLKTTISF